MGGHIYVIQGDITRCKADAIGFSTSTSATGGGMLFGAFAGLDPAFATDYATLGNQTWSVGDTHFMPANSARPAVVVTFAVGRGAAGPFRDPAGTAATLVRRTIECAVGELRKTTHKRLMLLLPSFLTGDGGLEDRRPELARAQLRAAADALAQIPNVDVTFVLFSPADHEIYRAARRRELPDLFANVQLDCKLRDAVRARECVVFIGSGLSVGAGMKDWNRFIAELCSALGSTTPAPTTSGEYLQAAQAYRDACKTKPELPTIEQVASRLFGKTVPLAPTVAHYLVASLHSQYVITTNYDYLIEKTYEARRYEKLDVAVRDKIPESSKVGRVNIVKFHGDAHHGGVIASTDDYKHYDVTHAAFSWLLGGLLLNHTFLFVGYSLSDSTFNAVYGSIKQMLGRAHRTAYATTFNSLDRNAPENVEPIVFEGKLEDQAAALCRWLDALADELSHPVLLADTRVVREVASPVLEPLRKALQAVGEIVVDAVDTTELGEADACTVADIAEMLCRHGWRSSPGNAQLFRTLALRVRDPARRASLLRAGQRHAESVEQVEAIERELGDR